MKKTKSFLSIFLIVALLCTGCSIGKNTKKDEKNETEVKTEKTEKPKEENLQVDITDEVYEKEVGEKKITLYTENSVVKFGRYKNGEFKNQEGIEQLEEPISKLNKKSKAVVEDYRRDIKRQFEYAPERARFSTGDLIRLLLCRR